MHETDVEEDESSDDEDSEDSDSEDDEDEGEAAREACKDKVTRWGRGEDLRKSIRDFHENLQDFDIIFRVEPTWNAQKQEARRNYFMITLMSWHRSSETTGLIYYLGFHYSCAHKD